MHGDSWTEDVRAKDADKAVAAVSMLKVLAKVYNLTEMKNRASTMSSASSCVFLAVYGESALACLSVVTPRYYA